MGRFAHLFAAAVLLPASMPVSAQTRTPVPETMLLLPISVSTQTAQTDGAAQDVGAVNRVVGYTAWDDDFFYIAVQVNNRTFYYDFFHFGSW